MKKLLVPGFGLACLLVSGCGDGNVSDAPPPAPAAATVDMGQAPAPVAAPPPAVTSAGSVAAAPAAGTSAPAAGKSVPGVLEGANAFSAPDLVNLNNAYQAFRSVEMRSPRDLNELVTSKQLESIPPAPGGKKFVIDEANLRIILVNQ